MKVVALAGGIGAARFLRGLVRAMDPADLTVVANTADDIVLHGLHVAPDLDTITYTLGGGVHPEQGWGRASEEFTVATELAERYGRPAWFTLGDRDLATHLVRTEMLASGGTLSEATAEITAAWGIDFRLLPMTDDTVTTRIHTVDGRDLHFEEWWVGERAGPDVATVELRGADTALPAPGVLPAIANADAVVLCPSNPVVSIGPILAVASIAATLAHVPVVGVSPIVGGAPVRGMADRLLPAMGIEVAADAVARSYGAFLNAWVLDEADADLADGLAADGLDVAVCDTIMDDTGVAEAVARTALGLVGG